MLFKKKTGKYNKYIENPIMLIDLVIEWDFAEYIMVLADSQRLLVREMKNE